MMSILIPGGILPAVYWARFFVLKYKRGKKIPLLLPLLFTCLFIPKITLLHVNPDHSMAGIRTDDLLALVMLIVSLRDAQTWKNRHILWGIGFLLAISASNLVSVFCGRAMGYDNAILFSVMFILRRFEYFAFALIGIRLARSSEHAEKEVLEAFTWMSVFHMLIALLQVAGLCNYAVMGFVDFCPDYWRKFAISTFNGHYEYGQFLCFGVAVYLCAFLRTKKAGWLGMTAASLGMIWLTKCRSLLLAGLLAAVLILFFSAWKIRKRWVRFSVLAGILLATAAGALVLTGTVKIGRFAVVNLKDYVKAWNYYMQTGDLRTYAEKVRSGAGWYRDMHVGIKDGSAVARIFKWGQAMDGFRQSPLFGYGPGVTEVIDGNYIKLLAETGIAGTLLWLGMYGYFLRAVWTERKRVIPARTVTYMMVSVLLGAAFIDMFEASKPMEMLWLAIGLTAGLAAGQGNNSRTGETSE